ncbi:MAG: hypothetical protein AMJ56_11995 [Anaerolineae bacterium SG8_19]|jgi:hypothetical protein|nr:MAG: hypothetical protein AMJ56_11995 [Anaerolineae bacterium SG8_19]
MIRRIAFLFLAVSMVLVLAVSVVSADSHDTFDVSIYHGINGRSLGASKAFPVDIWVNDVEVFSDVEFGKRLEASLPAGTYTIEIYSDDLGAFVDSMKIESAKIPAGVDVDIHAKFSAEKTPILKVKIK